MAKKRTPEELARIAARKEFVQSKPELDPAEARKRFYVQTRTQELTKSGVDVTKERKAALRQKFLSGEAQRVGFYTPTDLVKFAGNNNNNNNNNTDVTTTPTVKQTGGYVAQNPAMRTPIPGFKPGNVQKSTIKKVDGFDRLSQIVGNANKKAKAFTDEFTGAGAINRALDNKGASARDRIGEGLLGLGTGLLNTTGVGILVKRIRGAKNIVSGATKVTRLGPGAKPPLQLNPGPRVIDRVFDMPAVKTPLKKTPTTKTSTKKTATTKTSTKKTARTLADKNNTVVDKVKTKAAEGKTKVNNRKAQLETNKANAAQQKADQQIESGLATVAPKPVAAKPVAKKPAAKKPAAKKPSVDEEGRPMSNLGKPGEGGNPFFKQTSSKFEAKTITGPGSAGTPRVSQASTPAPAAASKPKPAFRTVFKNQKEYNEYMRGGGADVVKQQTLGVRQTFIEQNRPFIDGNARVAGAQAADRQRRAARRAGAVERLNEIRRNKGLIEPKKVRIPKSKQALRQPVKKK